MYKHYLDLTPAYLDGRNIRRHAEVVDSQNDLLQDKINEISLQNTLTRPVMFEKEVTEDLQVFQVYISTIHPIKEVIVTDETGSMLESYNYTEEDAITTASYDLSQYLSSEYNLTSETVLVNPGVCVEVVTYDEWEHYTKAYPENDHTMQWQNETLDTARNHDQYLDRIGALLNIPRRKYTTYQITDRDNTTPAGMGKQVTGDTVQECTEDDYQYYKRLNYFIEHYSTDTLSALMLYILYEYRKINVFNSYTRREDPIIAYYMDVQEEPFNPATMLISVEDNPSNIQELTSDEEKKRFLDLYNPLTRPTTILNLIDTMVTLDFLGGDKGNCLLWNPRFSVQVSDTDGHLFPEVPVRYYFDDETVEGSVVTGSGESPSAVITRDVVLSRGGHSLTAVFDKRSELAEAQGTFNFNYLLHQSIPVTPTEWTQLPKASGRSDSVQILRDRPLDALHPEYNIRLLFTTPDNIMIGLCQPRDSYTHELQMPRKRILLWNCLEGRDLNLDDCKGYVVRLYNTNKVTVNGTPVEWTDIHHAPLYLENGVHNIVIRDYRSGVTFDLNRIAGMEYSQLDSLVVPWPVEYVDAGTRMFLFDSLYRLDTGEHTFMFELEFGTTGTSSSVVIDFVPDGQDPSLSTPIMVNDGPKRVQVIFTFHDGISEAYIDGKQVSGFYPTGLVDVHPVILDMGNEYFKIVDVAYAPVKIEL